MINCDFHMHTSFSTDSEVDPEQMIKGAVQKGLSSICITDHWDEDFPFYEDLGKDAFRFDPERYFQRLTELQRKYADKIDIRIGIELGLQEHLGNRYKKFVQQYPFDFVIGSVHLVNGTDPYYGEIFRNRTDEEAYQETFRVMLENLKHIEEFDVLGHIDYIVRYGKHQAESYSYQKFAPWLDEILKQVIEMGKGIELNTAGLKYGLGFAHPHPDVLKRYRELGGEVITIGSDAHKPEHIAYDFEQAEAVLKACGFKYYTEFKARKPIFRQLL